MKPLTDIVTLALIFLSGYLLQRIIRNAADLTYGEWVLFALPVLVTIFLVARRVLSKT